MPPLHSLVVSFTAASGRRGTGVTVDRSRSSQGKTVILPRVGSPFSPGKGGVIPFFPGWRLDFVVYSGILPRVALLTRVGVAVLPTPRSLVRLPAA